MYICLCYGITDQHIDEHLDQLDDKTTMKNVHRSCSGAPNQKCGKCGPMIRDVVDRHNNKITIDEISESMKEATQKEQETL